MAYTENTLHESITAARMDQNNTTNNNKSQINLLKFQNISSGNSIEKPNAAVVVPGTVAGRLTAMSAKVWRAQKATIRAKKKLFVEKEIIGADFEIRIEEIGNRELKDDELLPEEKMLLSAPIMVIGTEGEVASASKKIIIETERIVFHNINVHHEILIVMGREQFEYKTKNQGKPRRVQNRLNMLEKGMEEDMEDIERRMRRPGNEALVPLFQQLVKIKQVQPNNTAIILSIMKKLLSGLGIVNYSEILQKLVDYNENKEQLDVINQKLEKIYKRLKSMMAILKISELKSGGKIIIRCGDGEETLRGPIKNKTLSFKNILEQNPETNFFDNKIVPGE